MILTKTQADINESTILEFGRAIASNGFSSSQIEIDDNWESCYGEATFNLVSRLVQPCPGRRHVKKF